jgi:SNF2 family DNA or RNA helicase
LFASSVPLLSSLIARLQEQTIEAEGEFGTKVEAIVRCVKQLVHDDPQVKVLLYSQYPRMLDLVGQALKANHLAFLYPDSMASNNKEKAKLISKFKTDETKALLLYVCCCPSSFVLVIRNLRAGLFGKTTVG